MNDIFNTISQAIINTSDFVCGVPEFLLLIGGGLSCLFIRARCQFAVCLGLFANCEKSKPTMAVNRRDKSAHSRH